MSESKTGESPTLAKGFSSLLLLGVLLFGLYALTPWLTEQTGHFFGNGKEKATEGVDEPVQEVNASLISQLREQWPEKEDFEILHIKRSKDRKQILFDIKVDEGKRRDLYFHKDGFGRFIYEYQGVLLKLYPEEELKPEKSDADGN